MLSPPEVPRNASRTPKRRPRERGKTKRAVKDSIKAGARKPRPGGLRDRAKASEAGRGVLYGGRGRPADTCYATALS